MARSLSMIALDIMETWGAKTSPHARPYVKAMSQLDKITDTYYADSGKSIVLYFLSNSSGWRGDDAKRIKAELRKMVDSK
jgi:hypothetical protein